MKFNNITRKDEFEEGDLNVGCVFCGKLITREDLVDLKCKKCGLDFKVEVLRMGNKIGFLMDEKISQFKRLLK